MKVNRGNNHQRPHSNQNLNRVSTATVSRVENKNSDEKLGRICGASRVVSARINSINLQTVPQQPWRPISAGVTHKQSPRRQWWLNWDVPSGTWERPSSVQGECSPASLGYCCSSSLFRPVKVQQQRAAEEVWTVVSPCVSC